MMPIRLSRAHLFGDAGGNPPVAKSACGKWWPESELDPVMEGDARCKACLAASRREREGKVKS